MINLLPAEIKDKYRSTSRAYGISVFYVLGLAIIGLAAVGLGTYNYVQQVNLNQKQSQLDSLNSTQLKSNDLSQKAAFVQDRLASSSSYQETKQWETVLGAIANDTPTSIQLASTKLAIGQATQIVITGQASDARSPILFEQKLNQDSNFTSAQLTALTQATANGKTTYSFSLTVGVKNVAN